ncbi:hypothetical protein SDC9_157075 [bioreactor metagenome]|uniref:Uncharacterized protein n=1 Tax=bioreactor metagenome TaxID=1076179 RepID=A0A645FBG4_9ZZZZ
MQVYWPIAYFASARKRKPCFSEAAKHRAHKEYAGSEFLSKMLRHFTAVCTRSVHNNAVLLPFHLAAHAAQYLKHIVHIAQMGTIMQHNFIFGEQRRRQYRQYGVFGSWQAYFPLKPRSAGNDYFCHPPKHLRETFHRCPMMRMDIALSYAARKSHVTLCVNTAADPAHISHPCRPEKYIEP